MDTGYGVYVSIRSADGLRLWSSNRETQAELETDFENAKEWLDKAFLAPVDEAQAVANVVQAFPTSPQAPSVGSVSTSPAPTATAPSPDGAGLEMCNICGNPKSKWVPPGVSKKSGKPYQGFFSCPTNHR